MAQNPQRQVVYSTMKPPAGQYVRRDSDALSRDKYLLAQSRAQGQVQVNTH